MQSWLHDMEWAIAMRSDLLTPVFKAFSALGYSGFLLLFVPIGLILFIALRKGFQAVEGVLENGRTAVAFIRAFISGVYLAALAPWIFQRLKLADKGKPAAG